MHRDQGDCLLLGIGPAFDLTDGLLPVGAHVAGESPQSADVVGPRHFEEEIHVGDRPLGAGLEALSDLRADMKRRDRIGEKRVRRRGPCAPAERRQLRQDILGERMVHACRIGPEREHRQPPPFRINRQSFRDVEQLGFGQADQRTAQQRAEGERVTRVRQAAGQRDQVLDLLTAEEALAGLGGHRDRQFLQRLLEPPKLGANRRQQRDVAETTSPHLAGVMVADLQVADHPVAEIGHRQRFAVAYSGGFRLLALDDHLQRADARLRTDRGMDRRQLGEARLPVSRQHRLEPLVDECEDRLDRPEVGCDLDLGAGVDRRPRGDVGVHVGAAETVDRLLGVAHHEQTTGAQRTCKRVAPFAVLSADQPQDLDLQRIGVLEFVDHDVTKALRQRPPHLLVVPKQVARGVN